MDDEERDAAAAAANTDKIKARLVKALSTAHQAISADIEGDRATAIALYEEAAQQLEEIIPFVPGGHAKVMARYSTAYANRLRELEELSSSRRKDNAFRVPPFPIHFVPRPLAIAKLPDVPTVDLRRPFWLMRLLALTLQTGSRLTHAVYVSREVWMQDGAHSVVKAIPAKTRYCEQLVDLLSGLQAVDKADHGLVASHLDHFLASVDVEWKALRKELPSRSAGAAQRDEKPAVAAAPSSRAWMNLKQLRTRMVDPGNTRKTELTVAYNSYLPWLLSVLETSQVLEAWVAYFERCTPAAPEAIWQRLHRVSVWFYMGLCGFVLRDMFTLLVRYMHKSRYSYSRLLPPNFLSNLSSS